MAVSKNMDAFGDNALLWQLATAIVALGALVVLVLAYRRRNGKGD